MVCQRWMEASQHPNFIEDHLLKISQVTFTDDLPPITDFLDSFRIYKSIIFTLVEFGNTSKFWNRFGDSINALAIRSSDIREKDLSTMLKALSNLRTLRIEGCRELLMPGRLFEHEPEKDLLQKSLETVENLSLANSRYLSDALFNRIVTYMPNIQQLDLSRCHISFHKGLYRKFYPGSQLEPSESVLTFLHISSFIEKHASQLKRLDFSMTLIDGAALETLALTPDLQLERVTLRQCDQLTNPGVLKLVQMQSHLISLDFSYSSRLTDQGVMAICDLLPKLKELKLRRCRALTDLSVKELKKLEEIRVLDISEIDNMTSVGILEGIASKNHMKLRELYASALNICEKSIIRMTEVFPNLLVLDLSCCINTVNDLCVQMIFKNLIFLRHLNLEMCDKISDAGLTGLSMSAEIERHEEESKAEEEERKKSLEVPETENVRFDQLTLSQKLQRALEAREQNYFKISLGSKAEEEIKNDAKCKIAMQEMCDLNEDERHSSGFSINQLKGLRILKLAGCSRITDVSLKYCFEFLELKELSLARCYQISIKGIQAVVKRCPSIEILNLAECHSINDKAIELITEKLQRLTSLSLERCIQLTDYTLDYIAMNCKVLKVSLFHNKLIPL